MLATTKINNGIIKSLINTFFKVGANNLNMLLNRKHKTRSMSLNMVKDQKEKNRCTNVSKNKDKMENWCGKDCKACLKSNSVVLSGNIYVLRNRSILLHSLVENNMKHLMTLKMKELKEM